MEQNRVRVEDELPIGMPPEFRKPPSSLQIGHHLRYAAPPPPPPVDRCADAKDIDLSVHTTVVAGLESGDSR